MKELKPCPFCGGKPDHEQWHGGGPNKTMIECCNDDCEVNPGVTGETPDEAADKWNKRAE